MIWQNIRKTNKKPQQIQGRCPKDFEQPETRNKNKINWNRNGPLQYKQQEKCLLHFHACAENHQLCLRGEKKNTQCKRKCQNKSINPARHLLYNINITHQDIVFEQAYMWTTNIDVVAKERIELVSAGYPFCTFMKLKSHQEIYCRAVSNEVQPSYWDREEKHTQD